MPTRTIDVDGKSWLVFPSGRVTQYDRDEFGIIFVNGLGADRKVRVTRSRRACGTPRRNGTGGTSRS